MATKTIQVTIDGKLATITVTVSDTAKASTNRQGRTEPLPFHFGPGTTVYWF